MGALTADELQPGEGTAREWVQEQMVDKHGGNRRKVSFICFCIFREIRKTKLSDFHL